MDNSKNKKLVYAGMLATGVAAGVIGINNSNVHADTNDVNVSQTANIQNTNQSDTGQFATNATSNTDTQNSTTDSVSQSQVVQNNDMNTQNNAPTENDMLYGTNKVANSNNDQDMSSQHFNFYDNQTNNLVGTASVSGTIGSTQDVNIPVPKGYQVIDSQKLPTQLTFTADMPDIDITVKALANNNQNSSTDPTPILPSDDKNNESNNSDSNNTPANTQKDEQKKNQTATDNNGVITQTVNYVDENTGTVISSQTVTGSDNETVDVPITIPDGYSWGANDDVPNQITLKVGTPAININVIRKTTTTNNNTSGSSSSTSGSSTDTNTGNGQKDQGGNSGSTGGNDDTDPDANLVSNTIEFQYNNQTVGKKTYTGAVGTTLTHLDDLAIPNGYRVADGQSLPVTFEITDTTRPYIIQVVPVNGGNTSDNNDSGQSQGDNSGSTTDDTKDNDNQSSNEENTPTNPDGATTISGDDAQKQVSLDIEYVDGDGNVIARDTVSGKVGDQVTIPNKIPTNWEEVDNGQDGLPETLTLSHDIKSPLKFVIQHKTEVVNSNKKEVKRTVTIIAPDGKQSKQTQTATFTQNEVKDLVTGTTSTTDWSGDGKLDAMTLPTYDGYVPDHTIDATTVTKDSADINDTVTYVQGTSSEDVEFVDENNNVIQHYTLSGKTGETKDITTNLPEGYELIDTAPKSILLTGGTMKPLILHVKKTSASTDNTKGNDDKQNNQSSSDTTNNNNQSTNTTTNDTTSNGDTNSVTNSDNVNGTSISDGINAATGSYGQPANVAFNPTTNSDSNVSHISDVNSSVPSASQNNTTNASQASLPQTGADMHEVRVMQIVGLAALGLLSGASMFGLKKRF